MNWYYALGDQRQGPVPEAELEALIAAGTITADMLVWKEGMANWAPLKEARPASLAGAAAPPGWICCTATARYFPPEEIVYIEGKPYSAAAKAAVLEGVMQGGVLPSSDIERIGPAWERRAELGFFRSIWQTIRGVLTEPAETFATMKREGGLGAPLAYYVLVPWVGVVCLLFYTAEELSLVFTSQPDEPPFPVKYLFVAAGILAVLMPIFLILGSFLSSGILHLSLMLCQGAKRPFETTFRAYCYAWASATSFLIVPLLGGAVGAIWGLVSLCIGLAKAHEINTGRAVLAVFLPSLVCIGLVVAMVLMLMSMGFLTQLRNITG